MLQASKRVCASTNTGSKLSTRVRQYLGNLDTLAEISLQKLASEFCMSTRTLNRKLSYEGYKYSQLLDEERARRCMEYLMQYKTSTEFIASALGYANVDYFYRSAKSWRGEGFYAMKIRATKRTSQLQSKDLANDSNRTAPCMQNFGGLIHARELSSAEIERMFK